jgi:hypothetical protein
MNGLEKEDRHPIEFVGRAIEMDMGLSEWIVTCESNALERRLAILIPFEHHFQRHPEMHVRVKRPIGRLDLMRKSQNQRKIW